MEAKILNKLSKSAREYIIEKEARLRELDLEINELNLILDKIEHLEMKE